MKIHVIAMVVILLVAGGAQGQPADTDDNSSGIYFDEGAGDGTWCATVTQGGTVTAYLCLTRGLDESGFIFWEGRLDVSAGGAYTGFRIRGDGTNSATEPDFVVTYGTPLPYHVSESTVLLEMDVFVDWEFMVAMRWWPTSSPSSPSGGSPLPTYATVDAPTTYVTLGYSFDWDAGVPNWCAAINDPDCLLGPIVVPTTEVSWGDIKNLYR